MNIKKIGKVLIPVALMMVPFLTLALVNPTIPVDPGKSVNLQEIQDLIQKIANFLIIVSIVIAVGAIVWGAIIWMTAGGNDDRVKSGKSWVINGIIGAAVVFAIGAILSTLKELIARTFFG